MQALAFLLCAAGLWVAFDVIERWIAAWKARSKLARRRHARPMTRREYRDTYYLGIEKEW